MRVLRESRLLSNIYIYNRQYNRRVDTVYKPDRVLRGKQGGLNVQTLKRQMTFTNGITDVDCKRNKTTCVISVRTDLKIPDIQVTLVPPSYLSSSWILLLLFLINNIIITIILATLHTSDIKKKFNYFI